MTRLPELTGLRCVAILMVVLSHAGGTLVGGYQGWLSPVRPLAGVGVQIFFVLSGFLITGILRAEYEATGRLGLYAFYRRRVLRIWPASYAFLLVLALLTWAGQLDIGWQQFTYAALQVWNYGAALNGLFPPAVPRLQGEWFLGHFWSLALEEQFYWIWPPMLVLFLRTGRKAWLPLLILCIPLLRIATYFLAPRLRGQLGMMLHTGLDTILIGCWCALRRDEIAARIRSWKHGSLWLTLAFVALVGVIPQLGLRLGGFWTSTYGVTVAAALAGLLVVALATRKDFWLSRLLRIRAFVFVGSISYSLYLWQQLFLYGASPVGWGFPYNILQAVGAACLSYWFIELPFTRMRDRPLVAQTPLSPAVKAEAAR
ncbi:acyltransferase [Variovorax sp. J22R133]|uniref:acyltransferase family protein n=1 Tax=Variovorax brevis TaxID=3053503 RepID=UPI0025776610|nr:acyltransferase [Variovorax sp. J22R133]MDM0116952.1 acyltransferase [Variovorax sp. J22R133]